MNELAPLAIGSKPAPGDLLYVQGFVNTLDVESGSDAFAEAAGVSAWFSAHLHLPGGTSVSEDERRRVVALRGALRVGFWGALAMVVSSAVGSLFDVQF